MFVAFLIPLFLAIISIDGTTIKYFDAYVTLPLVGNVSTFGSDYIQMWAEVLQCPTDGCACTVDPGARPLVFSSASPNLASMNFTNLQPVTPYTFVLTCSDAADCVQRTIQTDVGAPSVPQSIRATLGENQRIKLSWSQPAKPAGPIDRYRVFIDRDPTPVELRNDQVSYEISDAYVYGDRHQFFLSACNINRENTVVCSSANEGKVEFYLPSPETTTKSPVSPAPYSKDLPRIYFVFAFYLLASRLV